MDMMCCDFSIYLFILKTSIWKFKWSFKSKIEPSCKKKQKYVHKIDESFVFFITQREKFRIYLSMWNWAIFYWQLCEFLLFCDNEKHFRLCEKTIFAKVWSPNRPSKSPHFKLAKASLHE